MLTNADGISISTPNYQFFHVLVLPFHIFILSPLKLVHRMVFMFYTMASFGKFITPKEFSYKRFIYEKSNKMKWIPFKS